MGRPLLAALAAAITAAVFLPSLKGAFLNFDDDFNFVKNLHYRGLGIAQLKWMLTDHFAIYMPVTWMTLGLDYVVWGMNPFGYHLTNLFLHCANSILCFFLLEDLLGRALPQETRRRRGGMALAGTLFFSIHPLRVESVAWITERRDVISGLFILLSMLAYLRSTDGPSRKTWSVLSLVAFAVSILCKTMCMALPLVLLLLDVWPLRRWERGQRRSLLWEKIPWFALMLGAVALTAWAQTSARTLYSVQDYPLSQRVGQPGYRLSFYVVKTLWPSGLSPLYFYRPSLGLAHVLGWAAILVLSGILILRRRRDPAVAVAWASFLLLISPVSGLVQAGPHFAADRYTYLACLPFAALFAGALALPNREPLRLAAAWGAGLILACLGALTVHQCGVWKDSIALWNRAIALDPDVYFSLQNRGSARMDQADWTGALSDFNRAIELNPQHPNSWYGRGVTRASLGDQAAAVEDLTVALSLDPTHAETYSARGLSRAKLGDRTGALADADEALRRAPDSFTASLHRGLIRALLGDPAGALDDFSRAIRISPDASVAYLNRGMASFRLGRIPEAMDDFRRTLELSPDQAEALAQRGSLRLMMRDVGGGIADLTESLRLKPDPSVYLQRASARALSGGLQGAVEDCGEAIRLNPDVPDGWASRGRFRLQQGDLGGAADLEKALQVAPRDWLHRTPVESLLRRSQPR